MIYYHIHDTGSNNYQIGRHERIQITLHMNVYVRLCIQIYKKSVNNQERYMTDKLILSKNENLMSPPFIQGEHERT